jgi:hypothetical protein
MSTFILKTILFSLPILVLLAVTNWYGDAAHIFSKSGMEYKVAEYIIEGYNVENISNVDERQLQKALIKLFPVTPDTIFLGSSRIMGIGATFTNNETFNHGVSGCSIEDMIAIFQMYRQRGELPSKIIIGLDPWIFNKNDNQDRWKTIEREFYLFFDNDATASLNWALYCKQIVSPSYFQSSSLVLMNSLLDQGRLQPTPIQNRTELGNTFSRLTDGTVLYSKIYNERSIEDIEAVMRSFIAGRIYSLERYDSFCTVDIENFEILVNNINSSNIELEFVLLPFPPIVYDYLVKNDQYSIIEDFEAFVIEFAKNRNIELTGSLSPWPLNLDSSKFHDGLHLTREGISMMLDGKQF